MRRSFLSIGVLAALVSSCLATTAVAQSAKRGEKGVQIRAPAHARHLGASLVYSGPYYAAYAEGAEYPYFIGDRAEGALDWVWLWGGSMSPNMGVVFGVRGY